MWPTPAAQDAKNATLPPSQIHRDTVPGAVMREMKLWPTPAASQDGKPIRPLAPSEQDGGHGTMLVGAVGDVEPQKVGGQLNPDWVEALMCVPEGWTDAHREVDIPQVLGDPSDYIDYIRSHRQPALMGQAQHEWEPTRVVSRSDGRVARLKMLGNGVVPIQILPIMAAIKQINDMMR